MLKDLARGVQTVLGGGFVENIRTCGREKCVSSVTADDKGLRGKMR